MGATYDLAVGFISNSLVKVICLYGKSPYYTKRYYGGISMRKEGLINKFLFSH